MEKKTTANNKKSRQPWSQGMRGCVFDKGDK